MRRWTWLSPLVIAVTALLAPTRAAHADHPSRVARARPAPGLQVTDHRLGRHGAPQAGTLGRRGVAPQGLTLLFADRPLHPGVRTVTLLPGESIRLAIDDHDSVLLPVTTGFDLRVRVDSGSGPVHWQSDGGSIVTDRSPRLPLARYVAPPTPGIYHLRLVAGSGDATRPVFEVGVLVLTPFAGKRAGVLSGYRIGDYPQDLGLPPAVGRPPYDPLRGFVAVTRDVQDMPLSRHFRLRDFLCKQQPDHFPKYVVIDVRLLDKLERLIDRLDADGHPVTRLAIMSGYRTPFYNRTIGNDSVWSRHAFGDAADVFVDEDSDGVMDDLDHDGRITRADAAVLLRTVDALDRDARLAGGAAAYAATAAHGPFVHVDVRGYRARW